MRKNIFSRFIKACIPLPKNYRTPTVRYKIFEGIYLELDISNRVDWYNYFELPQKELEYFIAAVKNGNYILDIGANIGTTAIIIASTFPHKTIIAFEPGSNHYKKLQMHVVKNNFENIRTEQLALGNEIGDARLTDNEKNNSGMSYIRSSDKAGEKVFISTLDQFLAINNLQNIDAIKIDVEGFEEKVLLGASQLLTDESPVILLEMDPVLLNREDSTPARIFNILENYGYSIFINANTGEIINNKNNVTYPCDMLCRKM